MRFISSLALTLLAGLPLLSAPCTPRPFAKPSRTW